MINAGDHVIYHPGDGRKIRAFVVAIMPSSSSKYDEIKISFDDQSLIPPEMVVPEWTCTPDELPTGINLLHPISGGHVLGKPNPDMICPVCSTPWHETPHNGGIWYDCLKCGQTKESILAKN